MKRIIFLITFIYLNLNLNAQNTYPLKEYYDKLYTHYVPSSIDYSNHSLTGNSLSWTLSSLLRSYQTTEDKGYLIKFINLVIRIQNGRQDKLHPNNSAYPPKWTLDTDIDCDNHECTYFNSMLIYPMAEFVNMIISEPNHILYNTDILNSLIEDEDMQPAATILGYGDFAMWLGARVEETILYMNDGYWDYNYGIKRTDGNNDNFPAEMNMQSPFGCAVLFMGLANTNFGYGNNRATYLYQAQIIADHIKGNIDITDLCNGSYHYPLLRDMASNNNSYWWHHYGWRIETNNGCLSSSWVEQLDYPHYVSIYEDVSHGAMDLFFIRACYESQLAPCNTCDPYFTGTEMERFKNTFTKNIYYTTASGGHFYNSVVASDDPVTGCGPPCAQDRFWGEALDWMPLYHFDDETNPKVYDVLMNHTVGVVQTSSTQNLTGAQSYLGLSEVVKAQWDKECGVNLTLYNRDMVYDQDFFARNDLIVAPLLDDNFHDLNTAPFAEPPTFVDNGSLDRFVIEQGKTVNMMAGSMVKLLPGFRASSGCNFTASILSCSQQPNLAPPHHNNGSDNNTLSNLPTLNSDAVPYMANSINTVPLGTNKNAIRNFNFNVFPSPTTSGKFALFFNMGNEYQNNVVITDMLGKIVYQSELKSLKTDIDLSSCPSGVYLIKVMEGDRMAVQKIVKM